MNVKRDTSYLVGHDSSTYDDAMQYREELLGCLPSRPTIVKSEDDWMRYLQLEEHSVCFKYIPNNVTEEVAMERLLTCDGLAPFGHCGVIALAVKHDYVRSMTGGPDDYEFNGMVYVTFTSRDLACLFQSYWRSRKMFSSLEVKNAQGYVLQQAQCRFINVGNCKIVGR